MLSFHKVVPELSPYYNYCDCYALLGGLGVFVAVALFWRGFVFMDFFFLFGGGFGLFGGGGSVLFPPFVKALFRTRPSQQAPLPDL